MTEERAADVLWPASTPEPPPSPPAAAPNRAEKPASARSAPIRGADAMYEGSPPLETPPQRRVVAKAAIAMSGGEVMYEEGVAAIPSGDQETVPPEGAADAEQPASESKTEDAPPADIQELQITSTMALRAPDGFGDWDVEALNRFAPIVERYGLVREHAQELLDVHVAALLKEGADAQHAVYAQLEEGHSKQVNEWRRSIKSDPEIRAYGVENARIDGIQTMKQFFSPELRELFTELGIVNHPHLVRGLLKIRGAVSNSGPRPYRRDRR